jgi:ABC-type phosphate transport system substrate-binding protein
VHSKTASRLITRYTTSAFLRDKLGTAITAVAFAPAAAAALKLEGSGASVPFPIYSAWFKQFSRDKAIMQEFTSTGARIQYQSKGSGADIQDRFTFIISDQAQGQADALGYIPLPEAVIERVKNAATRIK